jgi:putative peptidoglycan lipid II flippase
MILTRLEQRARTLWQQRLNSSTNRKILWATLVVAICTFAVKLLAAAKETLVAATFGVGDTIDAFVMAYLLPSFVVSVIANSCNAALIPTYIRVREQQGHEAAQRLFSETVLVSSGLFLMLTGLLALSGPMLLGWLAPEFSPAKQVLTSQLFYLFLPVVLLSGLTTIWQAVLNAKERFASGALAPLMVPLASIVVLLLAGPNLNIFVLAASLTLGFLLQLGMLGWSLQQQGISLLPRWHGASEDLWQVIGQYWPMVAGGILVNSTPIVDRAMAATLPAGSVSVLNYAYKISALIIGVTTTALSTALIPYFSKMIAKADWEGVRHSLQTYIKLVIAVTLPLSALLFFASEPIVRLVYERGAFTASDTALVAQVQAMYVLQIPFYTLHIVFVRLISSLRANSFLMWATLINTVFNIVFDYLFIQLMGLPGIALANTVVYAVKLAFVGTVGYWLLGRMREQCVSP